MIEKTVRDFLEERLPVPVKLGTPPGPPESYVLIQKVGSGEENGLQRATLAIQSLAPTLYEAAALNAQVKLQMRALTGLPRIFRAHPDNDYDHTNPKDRRYRYQAVYTIYYKED